MQEEHEQAEQEDPKVLVGVLAELIRQHGPGGAASELGVSYQTVRRSIAAHELSNRLRTALKRHLLLREGVEVPDSPWEKRLCAVEQRLREMVEGLCAQASLIENTQTSVDALHRELEIRTAEVKRALVESAARARGLQLQVNQLTAVQAQHGDGASPQGGHGNAGGTGDVNAKVGLDAGHHDRDEEPQSLVSEWTLVRAQESQAKTKLEKVIAKQRRLAIELTLIQEHRESIPPGAPWSDAVRSREMSWRRAALRDCERDKFHLELRRRLRQVLTLGLWRG